MPISADKKEAIAAMWAGMQTTAHEIAQDDPWVQSMLYEHVINRASFAEALSHTLAGHLQGPNCGEGMLQDLFVRTYEKHPLALYQAVMDLEATVDRDPACQNAIECMLFYKGFQAIQTHRIAYYLWQQNRHFLAKMLQSACSRAYEVDIHPAAVIGHGILVDHATNIVVGETAKVGNQVSILHGVTLGGTGKESGDRHPKISDGVMLGAHAQLLGNIRVGKGAKVGAGAVVLENVPPHTTVAGVPAVAVGKPHFDMPALAMEQDFTHDS
jgi:serine O-acetyltransferase